MSRFAPTRLLHLFHSRHGRHFVLLLLALMLGPAAFFFWFAPPRETIPIEALLPTRLAAGLRVQGLPQAWARHWLQRAATLPPGQAAARPPTPDDALERILEALEQWPEWVGEYGLNGARLRLQLYQETLFTALGSDAWLLFGQWETPPEANAPLSGPTASAPVGLVLLLRSQGPFRQQIGPLLDLAFAGYTFRKTWHNGVGIYEYRSRRLSRSISFCQVGGWIIGSWRQHGPGPLPAIIDAARRAARLPGFDPPVHPAIAPLLEAPGPEPEALRGVFYPEAFWSALRQFTVQRGKTMSKKSEGRLALWQQRLEGAERVTLRQRGDSLLNLSASLSGAAPQRWHAQWRQEELSTTTLGPAAEPTTATLPADAGPVTRLYSEMVELELDLPFARLALPVAGFEWDPLLEEADWLDLLAPGLRTELNARLMPWAQPPAGRLGLALYPGRSPLLPDLLGWIDLAPLEPIPAAPARRWRELAASPSHIQPPDKVFFIQPPFGVAPIPETTSTLSPAWPVLLDRLYTADPTPPPALLGLEFGELTRALARVPEPLLKKKDRKRLRAWRTTADGLALAVGAAALRIDLSPTELRLSLETL